MSMASDLGVLGEVCEAMMVISEKGMEFGMETGEWLELRKRGEPSSLNHLIGLRTLSIKEFEPKGTLHERMRSIGHGARPADRRRLAGPSLSGVGPGLLEASLIPFPSRVSRWFCPEMKRKK